MKASLAAATLTALATFTVGTAPARAQQQLPVVRFHEYAKIALHLPTWVMIEKGLCEKNGIRCQPVTLATAPLAQAAAAAGSVDLVNSTIDTAMQAIAKGNDLVIVGASWRTHPYSLVMRSDVSVPNAAAGFPNNMAGLKGMKIGVSARGSSTEIFMKALLRAANMPEDSVSYIPVGAPVAAYGALASKQIDGALSWDPLPALCEATGTCKGLVDMRKGEGPASFKALAGSSVFFQARREYVQKNAVSIDAFNRGYGQAVAWLQDPKNFPEALAITKKNIQLGENLPNREKLYELIVRDQIERFTATLDRNSVKAWHDFLLENKVIDKPLPLDTIVYKAAP
jgi:NitT/TauT family transport system substrate-binding protein